MGKRFISIWFCQLKADWFCRRHPSLRNKAFVLATPDHGRMLISAASPLAFQQNINPGMAVADARAIVPSLQVFDDELLSTEKLLTALAGYCIRYTNIVAIDLPEGLKLDITGCTHLWGGEINYIKDIEARLKALGYHVRIAMADTFGAAWAIAHYGDGTQLIAAHQHTTAMMHLPVASLRLETGISELLIKLGLRQFRHIIAMARTALRRRFGNELINKLDLAIGNEAEVLLPVQPIEPYTERLPCLEPIVTATGIEIALQRLLETLCKRLQKENKGIRKAVFTGYRIDGRIEKIQIGTHRATHNIKHLYKLFEIHISTIEPALGIDLFMIEASKTEKLSIRQESLWIKGHGLNDDRLSELMDRLSNRFGDEYIHRYLPDERHWPERAFKTAGSLQDKPASPWPNERPRPLQLLSKPEKVEVAAPVPDYPPMLFRYNGMVHNIKKADGPERIEREWWMDQGPHRDYYAVEDEEGKRYWIFRSGHYEENQPPQWFIHGFFA